MPKPTFVPGLMYLQLYNFFALWEKWPQVRQNSKVRRRFTHIYLMNFSCEPIDCVGCVTDHDISDVPVGPGQEVVAALSPRVAPTTHATVTSSSSSNHPTVTHRAPVNTMAASNKEIQYQNFVKL